MKGKFCWSTKYSILGEAGSYVKEIINITTEERKHRKDKEVERQLTEEEKLEQEQRREKLLEAGKLHNVNFNILVYIYLLFKLLCVFYYVLPITVD